MTISTPNEVKKALVGLAIEKTLLSFGKPTYEKVIDILNKKYHCYLPDCYEHPEYLSEILQNLYGNVSRQIIITINKELEEYSYSAPVERFLEVISK